LLVGEIAHGAVSGLLHTVRTGEPAFEWHHGMGWWAYFATHPEAAAVHDAMFAEQSGALAEVLLEHLDLTGVATLVDVGGGYGGLLVPVLRAHPAMRGVIVDLPHAAAGAAERIRAARLADRCTFVAGDCFVAVPPGEA
jgi:hypothetical protein